jgi:hypothetical protein
LFFFGGGLGCQTWPVEDGETARIFNPLGTTIVNPSEGGTPTLTIEFTRVSPKLGGGWKETGSGSTDTGQAPAHVSADIGFWGAQFQREMRYPPPEFTRQQRIYDSTSHPCEAATRKRIEALIAVDPLHEFGTEELDLLRKHGVRLRTCRRCWCWCRQGDT